MVDHLDQTERVDRELNVVKRARFNQTIETYKTNEVPEPKFGVEPHTVKELPALPVRERQQDNMLLHQQIQDNMVEEEVVSFGQRAQQQQDQQQLQLRQHNIPHNPVGPDCILSMKTDSAVALKQMNTHTVTVRTRTAAQKLAFLRELTYQDPQIQPIYIPGPSQRADSQTKCLSGPALRKAQDYLNLRHVVTPVVSTIRVLGVDQSVADSSACERWEGCERKQEIQGEDSSCVRSNSPCLSQEGSLDQVQNQEGMQASPHQILDDLDPEEVPFLCRLRMGCNRQDQDTIFLQEYRRVVTVIRQEDIGVDVHDKRSPMPFLCGSSHMPRKEEGSAHKRTKPQAPTPKGDTSLADERVKADRETQRRERAQAKQRALQHASGPAKASMRDRGTESETKVVRKRPAQSEDETHTVSESGALPATPADSEMSQSATTTNPQQAMPAEESQPTQPDPQQPSLS